MIKRLLVPFLFLPSLLFAESLTTTFSLENGLKLIVKEDHRAPIMTTQVWYKVGSSYEHEGITGVSHVLEHMMFKGTKKLKANEFSKIIAANGGQENAFTSRDYTAYFQTMSADRLAISFELEADRMRYLQLKESEFIKELNVVKEERRLRTEDKPTAYALEQFYATAYRTLPYRHPVIGWMNDLDHLKLTDLAVWYKRWYAPNNATVVVVGDVNAQQVYKLAQQYFGELKPQPFTAPKPAIEVRQQGLVRLDIKRPAKQPYLLMGYKVPTLATAKEPWEAYALEILAAVLDGGNSARFNKDLVRGQRIAASADAGYSLFSRLSSLFTLDGTPTDKHTMQELETAFLLEINKIKQKLVEKEELKRIISQVVASIIFEQDSVYQQATQIGMLESVGLDFHLLETYVSELKKVTPEQIQQVAKKYLTEDRLTIAKLIPQKIEKQNKGTK